MKILIAIPTFENITPETFKSIYDLYVCDNEVDFEFVKGYDCAKARNAIASKTINGGYDYVLFVDSDIILPPETLMYFLEKPVPVCFGVYPHKNSKDGKAELFKDGTSSFELRFPYKQLDELPNRIRVKGAGFGCAFVSKSVLQKMKYPYFQYIQYLNGTFLSEDLYFCDEANKKHIELWADTRVRCGHLARYFQYE